MTPTYFQGACLSADCIVLSASILSSLDTTQDPCDSFYDFASTFSSIQPHVSILTAICVAGGWTKAHPIPADKGRFGQFNVLAQENQQIIREILESDVIPLSTPATRSYDEQILKKLRGLYSSCMNEDKLDQLGEKPLFQFVQTIRDLFRGESTEMGVARGEDRDKDEESKGLTAALSYLHSRGEFYYSFQNIYR